MLGNEYKYNKRFREYVDAYCVENRCTVEEALKKDEVKRAWRRYTDV